MKGCYVKEVVRAVIITCFSKEAKQELSLDNLNECANINSSKPLLVRDCKAKYWLFDGKKLINLKTDNYVQALETVRTSSIAK